jgi:hypothetical protein
MESSLGDKVTCLTPVMLRCPSRPHFSEPAASGTHSTIPRPNRSNRGRRRMVQCNLSRFFHPKPSIARPSPISPESPPIEPPPAIQNAHPTLQGYGKKSIPSAAVNADEDKFADEIPQFIARSLRRCGCFSCRSTQCRPGEGLHCSYRLPER